MCHHGTILLEGHEGEMDRYLKVPPERPRGHRGFVVGLRELGFKKERADIYSVICDSACEALNLEPVARSLTGEETGRAERLEREKYRKREFIFRFE
jgi:lipoate-protein ligase A